MSENLYSRFMTLLGGSGNIIIGECVAAVFGSCTIQLPGGSLVTATGAGTVSNKYFIYQRPDGTWRLDGEAPDLPFITVDI